MPLADDCANLFSPYGFSSVPALVLKENEDTYKAGVTLALIIGNRATTAQNITYSVIAMKVCVNVVLLSCQSI